MRDSQNLSVNSCHSAPPARLAQVFFSFDVMIQRTGPSPHFSLTCSPELGGSLNSWNARKIEGVPSSLTGGATFCCAASKAATAFFEYIEGSIVAFGCTARNASKSACAFSAMPRLASHTPR